MQAKMKPYLFIILFTLLSLPLLSAMTPSHEVQGGLPVRPTAVPVINPGALITLELDSTYNGYWTQVQWQNPTTEEWFDVDGWRGHVDQSGNVTWWVAPSDLGSGPFRWQVFTNEGDASPVMTSDNFNLPTARSLTVSIDEN